MGHPKDFHVMDQLLMGTENNDNMVRTKPRWPVIAWLAISQFLAVGLLIPWLAYAYLSYWTVYTSGSSTWEVIFVGVTFAYPIVVVLCAIQAWLLYRAHKDRQALIVTSVFLAWPLFYLVTIFVTS
jgi:hypothetical protein